MLWAGASGAAVNVVEARSSVWGSTPTRAHCDAEWTTLVTPSIALLRRLRVVSGSFVVAQGSDTSIRTHAAHVVRLVLSPIESEEVDGGGDPEDEALEDVVMAPLLAFNLGLRRTTRHDPQTPNYRITLRPAALHELGLAAPAVPSHHVPLRRLCDLTPAVATKAVIAPLLLSSLACRGHAALRDSQQTDGLLQAIRKHFAGAPRVLQVGDVFAVALQEIFPSPPAQADASKKRSPSLQEYHVPRHLIADCDSTKITDGNDDNDGQQSSTTATQRFFIPPPLPVDTSLLFFRVESLVSPFAHNASPSPSSTSARPLALRVTPETELLQTGSISAPAPDADLVREFLLAHEDDSIDLERRRSSAPSASALPARDALFDMLQPSQLCEVPVSVLLGGARGVGKSTLVHEVAKGLGVCVVEVPFTELTAQSELHLIENIREQVAKAQALAPCILYISHLFTVDKDDDEAEIRMAGALTECVRLLARSRNTNSPTGSYNIPLVACVEDVTEVPKFIRQCFLYELVVEAPDQSARLEFLKQLTRDVRLSPQVSLPNLAQATAGRTCGELSALITQAGMLAIERLASGPQSILDCLAGIAKDDEMDVCTITQADLDAALKEQQALASAAKMGGTASIPNVKWEDVGGLEDVKDEILDVVQLPLKHPELFASGVRQRSGILLYGPPGTGKTLLAKAIATECNMNFLSVKGPELLNMYIGESEKNVRQVFAKARSCRPCVLFFDELDSLAPMRGRGSDSGGVMDRVVSQLLTEIDGLSAGAASGDQVFVIGATNRPDLIESGLLRPGRFDRLLYLGICTERSAQLKVVQALTRKFALAGDVDLEEVVARCPLNFTGADFYALCSGALAAALKDRVEKLDHQLEQLNAEDCYSSSPLTVRVLLNRMTPEELRVQVEQRHFLASLEQVVPSVSPAELQHYERLKEQYSSRQP